jgi:hypothetical protein
VQAGKQVTVLVVTRLCDNADATFTTDDNCVMPVKTYQQAVCKVTFYL